MVPSTERFTLFFHGSCKPNPGPAGIGYTIVDRESNEVEYGSKYIGENTNNETEYKALIEGLKVAKKLKIHDLVVYGDSQLIINQTDPHMMTNWKIKQTHLIALNNEARD
eukprot:CAMPEP_0114583702 /NCGR_PEP_ID=MMETSP0125-20121206/7394_1 /TAXON_ID=485358 ORGANISM="Aristerostoma sp., Strain ATCC 50986" /NCGR_SAMPLE_ID=MMETSP0125 /ASSEMBLY_ACC=CAM_ASM_000245 /LENGTH=109 /DNA_ID=CAMNT_0001777341 /DNA_START=72 /DNA_END=398 /DNA_ORIENTATION=+